jgi:hypothetical protein
LNGVLRACSVPMVRCPLLLADICPTDFRFTPRNDIHRRERYVRFVPEADIQESATSVRLQQPTFGTVISVAR